MYGNTLGLEVPERRQRGLKPRRAGLSPPCLASREGGRGRKVAPRTPGH